jgi:xanthine dehydrogenase iron-sulfur cluster and FAD-binding subunit A
MAQMSRNNISGNLCRTEGSQSVSSAVKKTVARGTADYTDEKDGTDE